MKFVDLTSIHRDLSSLLRKELAPLDDLYCPGQVSFDFEQGGSPAYVEEGYYERFLAQFLRPKMDQRGPGTGQVLVLIGGIGTGKSTAVRRSLYEAVLAGKDNEADSNEPFKRSVFHLNFEGWESEDESSTTPEEDEERFWNQIAVTLRETFRLSLSPRDEIKGFWHWCLDQEKLLIDSPIINRFLTAIEPKISAIVDPSNSPWSAEELERALLEDRQELISQLSTDDLAWYHIFAIAYILQSAEYDTAFTYIFLDNVDHLPPALQKKAVEFIVKVTDVWHTKTVIAIRPLTWSRSAHGHLLIETELHYAPTVEMVLVTRINRFISSSSLSQDEQRALRAILATVTGSGGDPLLGRILPATAGISVRWAIRNFLNFMESQHLEQFRIDDLSTGGGLRISEFARAFFFSNRDQMLSHAFENLYQVNGDDRREYSTLKARILDYIVRAGNGRGVVNHIFQLLEKFGYSTNLVSQALDELLVRTRPLLWCEDGFRCLKPGSMGRVMATPIGRAYYDELLGETFYDEVCIAKERDDVVPLDLVFQHHQKFSDQDLEDIELFKRDAGGIAYYALYPSDLRGLCVIHWKRLFLGLSKRATREGTQYDPQRENYLNEKIEAIVGPPRKVPVAKLSV